MRGRIPRFGHRRQYPTAAADPASGAAARTAAARNAAVVSRLASRAARLQEPAAHPEVQVTVRDLMKTDIGACAPGDELATVLLLMRDRHCGWAPVVDGKGLVVGVITDRDAAMALLDHPGRGASRLTAREAMSRDVVGCGPQDRLPRVLQVMASRHVRRLPVLDERGHLAGVLSIDDIIKAAGTRGEPTAAGVLDALRLLW